ncbi:ribosomal protein S18 acetylase RimI-like enzyme [Saonia flava]|uniref:Ribosomal protein S18 acetylase RimI-like enzyme n=1 Tax=Saonia flava TaxID=523696 RepID=A0A846QY53_9FLAO|nr:GNAT family N-acetyltransferase [Saonia flava]NJB71562.1 ribosomal protein S18 acetylase RimI-like enzyme [Saonia flava]
MVISCIKCTEEHLQKLVEISKSTFSEAFEAENDPEDFESYMDFAFKEDKLLEELKNLNSHFYFVYSDDTLAGYFKLNEHEAQTEITDKDSMELERIYVVKEFQGNKIGEWMLGQAIKVTIEKDKKYIWLGVWEHNEKAIKFYQRHGFSKFGTHPYFIGKDEQTDWLMRYDLKEG